MVSVCVPRREMRLSLRPCNIETPHGALLPDQPSLLDGFARYVIAQLEPVKSAKISLYLADAPRNSPEQVFANNV